MKRTHIAVLCSLVLLSAGCVSRQVVEMKPKSEVVLTVARSGSSVTLQWQSEIGTTYTVLCSPRLGGGGQWQVLAGAEQIQGTGELIEITDQVPETVQRYYRLHIGLPQSSAPGARRK